MNYIKKKLGFSLFEVIIAMSLFLSAIVPIIQINSNILKTNRIYSEIEEDDKLFENISNIIKLRKFTDLKAHMGNNIYAFKQDEDDKIILFPKNILSKEIYTLNKVHLEKKVEIRVLETENINGVLAEIKMIGPKRENGIIIFFSSYE
ncbi:type IV pilus modification PilV family protein [Fusobacterium sp. PH5-44]|uniref:type IV pilus modification PilV family protein n=1 Tax=unclassified Fusobacterium TaxID=2648384 RepID=UPI003D1A1731